MPQPILVSDWLISKNLPLLNSYQVSIHLAKWFQRRIFFRNYWVLNRNKDKLNFSNFITRRDRDLSLKSIQGKSNHIAIIDCLFSADIES
jgi:hypothetical protein